MRKTDKKRDNNIRQVLTDVCETALDDYLGFQWLTHQVNYAVFPQSLKVICIFDTNDHLKVFRKSAAQQTMNYNIKTALAEVSAPIEDCVRQIIYDSEENCEREHAGDWEERLQPSLH